jgi:hypothetical protein
LTKTLSACRLSTVPALKMGLGLKKPEGTAGKSWLAILIGIFVAFGGVLFGYV